MVKLNAVLMVVLALAVVATAAFLSIEKPSSQKTDPSGVWKLFRKLADNDPDLRREAEADLRSLGPRVIGPLQEAAKSSDRKLAERATRLLREMEPPRQEAAAVPALESPFSEAAEAAEKTEAVELTLACHEPRVRPGGMVRFYVRLANHGTQPVLLARGRGWAYMNFAYFELEDEKGNVVKASGLEPPLSSGDEIERIAVKPGETFDLFAGMGDGRTALVDERLRRGTWKVRFVFDASEGSAYRQWIKASAGGVLLPPSLLISNAVALHVGD